MLEFGDKIYYLDIEKYSNFLLLPEDDKNREVTTKVVYFDKNGLIDHSNETTTTEKSGLLINVNKANLIETLLDIIMMGDDGKDEDVTLGTDKALENSSLAFKIAINTLIKYEILKEK